jgi:hypothetical protein
MAGRLTSRVSTPSSAIRPKSTRKLPGRRADAMSPPARLPPPSPRFHIMKLAVAARARCWAGTESSSTVLVDGPVKATPAPVRKLAASDGPSQLDTPSPRAPATVHTVPASTTPRAPRRSVSEPARGASAIIPIARRVKDNPAASGPKPRTWSRYRNHDGMTRPLLIPMNSWPAMRRRTSKGYTERPSLAKSS